MMRSIVVVIGMMMASQALGGVIIKQKQTSATGDSDVTQYISGDLFRQDIRSDKTLSVTILKKNNIIICTKDLTKAAKKGSCMGYDVRTLGQTVGNLGGSLKMEVEKYTLKNLNKQGKFAGRNCQYYSRSMVVAADMAGVMSQKQNVEEEFCVDKSVKLAIPESARSLMQGVFTSTNSKKVMQEMKASEQQLSGILLYHKSIHKSDIKVNGAMAAIPGMDKAMQSAHQGGDQTVETKTVDVKESNLGAKIFQVPLQDFIPPGKKKGKKKV